MSKRITANLPDRLLADAIEVTGKGITETLIEGLQMVARRRAYHRMAALKGRLDLRINVDASRERTAP